MVFLRIANWNTISLLAGRQPRILISACFLIVGVSTSVAPPAIAFEASQSLDTGIATPTSDQTRVQGEARPTPVAELMGSLAATRRRLDELSRLTTQATAISNELEASRARERNVLAEVQALHADRQELRDARDTALVRMQELDQALEQTSSITQALGQQLAAERQQKLELSDQKGELAAQLATLRSANTSVGKEVSSLEKQLEHKDAALEGLVSERDELQDRVAMIESELKGEQAEKDRLSAELAAFRSAAKTATDLARQHLLAVEGMIKELSETVSAASQGSEVERVRGLRPQSAGAVDPRLSTIESADDPKSSKDERLTSDQLIETTLPELISRGPPTTKHPTRSSLESNMVDALRQQREKLEGLMKQLENNPKLAE